MEIQPQEMEQWCWASVSVGVEHYMRPSSHLSQCELAQQVLHHNCCQDRPPCNESARLQDVLSLLGRLRKIVERRRRFGGMRAEIDAARPVCARIGWEGGGGHFVVIDGYTELVSGERLVH